MAVGVANGTHQSQHLLGRRKAADRSRKIAVCAFLAADDPRHRGQHPAKIDAISRAHQAPRLAEVENAELPAGLEHAKELAQAGFVIDQVAKSECGNDEVL